MVATGASRSRIEPLSSAQQEALHERLLRERAVTLALYRHDLSVGKASPDEGTEDVVDVANRANDQELLLTLSATEGKVIAQIDEALERLAAGGYGVCVHCQRPIGLPRLKAVPWARYCIDCQEKEEKGMLEL